MKIFSLFPFLFAFVFAYDENIAKRNLQLAAATYCSKFEIVNWDCVHCLSGIELKGTIFGDTNIIIADDSVQNATVFAFRGSSDIQNWISNLKFEFTAPYSDPAIKVHSGLYQEYMKYKDTVLPYLSNNKIIITGHSSGAALSMFMAYDIHKTHDVTVYTFGKPRIGNQNFVDSAKEITHYRITHHNDIVPHVPEEVLHYRHTNTEIWYPGDDEDYKICEKNEDPNCSNSCSPIHCDSIDDHLLYIGTNIGSDYCMRVESLNQVWFGSILKKL
jgi:hypothetical protein